MSTNNKKYNFELDQKEKTFVIEVWGVYQEADAEAFMEEYNKQVNMINPANYRLIVDSVELKTSKQDMLPMLKQCLKMYKNEGFKEIVMVTPDSHTAKVQLKRTTEDCGLDCEFSDNIKAGKQKVI